MSKIDRHELKHLQALEGNLDHYLSRVEKSLTSLGTRPDNIAMKLHDSINAMNTAIVVGKEPELVVKIMRLALSYGIANYQSILENENFVIHFEGNDYPIAAKKRTAYVGCSTWTRVFSLAVMLRDPEAIEFLKTISPELLKTDNIKDDPVDHSRVEFLKGVYDPDADIGDLLLKVYDDADMSKISADRSEYIHQILLPEMSVYRCIFSGLKEEFNEKLESAIQDHKKFWGVGDNPYDYDGWTSMRLLAAAVIAQGGRGMKVEVISDYIPSWIVNGDFG